jgi:hypothetical protein
MTGDRKVCRVHLENIKETLGSERVKESGVTGEGKTACSYCKLRAQYNVEIVQKGVMLEH